jgi:hypothetical protein
MVVHHREESDMEIWVKVTPGQGDEVWLVKLDTDGTFDSRFVLKSLPRGESPMAFAIDLARWMNITAKTVLEAGESFAAQVRYDPSRGVT